MSKNSAPERRVLALLALAQFASIWDFMLIMPLGPDIAEALHFDLGHIGWLPAIYSLAGAAAGILSARHLDRLDRRTALILCLGGLTLAALLATRATGFGQLMLARLLAGLFGGPLTAVILAAVSDAFPAHRRGEAMGKLMGSFALAAVLGVPLGLEIARVAGWRAPFLAIAAMSCGGLLCMRLLLPPMRGHLEPGAETARRGVRAMAGNRSGLAGLCMIATVTLSVFLIIPNISAFVQHNLGYPRERIGLLYFVGGIASFLCMRIAGRAADRIGYTRTTAMATAAMLAAMGIMFTAAPEQVPVMACFALFMAGSSVRNVTGSALVSRIPPPERRAGFLALVSALQQLTAGLGAFLSTLMLAETPTGMLSGMTAAAALAATLALAMPLIMRGIEAKLTESSETG